jgi:hypothetical protein
MGEFYQFYKKALKAREKQKKQKKRHKPSTPDIVGRVVYQPVKQSSEAPSSSTYAVKG